MTSTYTLGALAILGSLTACNPSSDPEPTAARVQGDSSAERVTHQATGTISAVEPGSVTINHGPVASLDWPAMTMSFAVPSDMNAGGLQPGMPVRFSFEQVDGAYALTAIDDPARP